MMLHCLQFYTVVACNRGDDSDIWQTPETWLELDDEKVLWAYYPFRNRQSCAMNYVEKNDPLGGKRWDVYKVTSLYFPEVHTTDYDKAEKLCREIGERPVTDEEARATSLKKALLVFSVRHAIEERNASQVNITLLLTKVQKIHLAIINCDFVRIYKKLMKKQVFSIYWLTSLILSCWFCLLTMTGLYIVLNLNRRLKLLTFVFHAEL